MKRLLIIACLFTTFVSGCQALPKGISKNGELFNFVVMGDNRPANIFRPEQPYIYYKVVEYAVRLNPVLILNTGDMILGYDAHDKKKAEEEFNDFEKVTAPIRAKNIPLYITMGNHSGYTKEVRKVFHSRYKNKETDTLYYSVDAGNSHFIVLCSELENEKAIITGKQFAWLKEDLKKAADKHIFVLLHRPLYPKIKHLTDSMNKFPEKRDELADLFKKYNVNMVFTGHVHVYNYSVTNGLSQIIAGGSGAPLAGTIEEGGFNHFFNVIVNGNDVDYRLIPLQNEVQLATQLLKEKRFITSIGIAGIAIEAVPDHPMAHIIAAVGYKKIGKVREFNNEISKLLPILKNKMEVNFRLGEFCLTNELNNLCDFFLAKALSLDANSFKVLYHYGQLKEKQKKNSEAIAIYKKAYPLTKDAYFRKDIKERISKLSKGTN
ncbi:MAG: hypothetical protein GY760_04425 [Deltaproteobacteria bacterium]|nr:hypothetical protein [Deltaproteobacteria bacterium]